MEAPRAMRLCARGGCAEGKRALRIARRGCQRQPSRGEARGKRAAGDAGARHHARDERRVARAARVQRRRTEVRLMPGSAGWQLQRRRRCVHDEQAAAATSDRNRAISRQPQSETRAAAITPHHDIHATRPGGAPAARLLPMLPPLAAIAAASAMTARGRAGGGAYFGDWSKAFHKKNAGASVALRYSW